MQFCVIYIGHSAHIQQIMNINRGVGISLCTISAFLSHGIRIFQYPEWALHTCPIVPPLLYTAWVEIISIFWVSTVKGVPVGFKQILKGMPSRHAPCILNKSPVLPLPCKILNTPDGRPASAKSCAILRQNCHIHAQNSWTEWDSLKISHAQTLASLRQYDLTRRLLVRIRTSQLELWMSTTKVVEKSMPKFWTI